MMRKYDDMIKLDPTLCWHLSDRQAAHLLIMHPMLTLIFLLADTNLADNFNFDKVLMSKILTPLIVAFGKDDLKVDPT